MGYLDIGLSSSQSIANKASLANDFNVSGGGAKQSITLYIVVGVVALAAVLWLALSRK